MKKIIEVVIFLLMAMWIAILPLRSVLYIYRVYKEYKNPPETVFEQVKPCMQKENYKNVEEERLYNYFKLGAKCKN